MEPFEKHQADVGELHAASSGLLVDASQAGDNVSLTTHAYQPVIDDWQGLGAAEAQGAPQPLRAGADQASASLAWAAVVTEFWAGKVETFNSEVDNIVERYESQGPRYGVTGDDPDDDEITQARQEALAKARTQWWEAYNTHILDGEDQAAAMLAEGPTETNLQLVSGVWQLLGNVFEGEYRPPMGDWQSLLIWLAGRASLAGVALSELMALRHGFAAGYYGLRHRIQQRLLFPLGGLLAPFGGRVANWWRDGLPDWQGLRDTSLSNQSWWQRASRIAGIGGPFAAGGLTGWNQWQQDQDYSTGERAGRSIVRGVMVGGGTAIGEAVGGRFGGHLGAWAGGVVGGAVADWGATEAVRGYSSLHHGIQERDGRAILDGARALTMPIASRGADMIIDAVVGEERAEQARDNIFGPNRATE